LTIGKSAKYSENPISEIKVALEPETTEAITEAIPTA